jgi:DNA-binding NarL/FixJ family response regulator
MDDATKTLLARVVERLEEHERRLLSVELLAGPMNFDTHELLHRRRIAVLELRERGLTIEAIAKALSISRGSVLKIVRGIPPPPDARAVDGRRIGKRAQGHSPGP